jgi:hypothetical protein
MKTKIESIRVILVPALVASFLGGGPLAARAEEPAKPPEATVPSEATVPTEAAAPMEAAVPMAPSGGEVARAVFARSIVAREPENVVTSLDSDAEQIFFFTELVGMEGQTVRHRWELDGQVMAEVSFQVGGPRWRVHSSKRLLPGQPGAWTVSVVDASGNVLEAQTLARALATPEPTSPTPPAAPER